MSINRCLVVAAHPDDEVLGCGGTIARLAREGHEVYIAVLGEGITARYAKRTQARKELLEELRARSCEVAKYLLAEDVFLFSFPDNRFDTVPLLDIVKVIENLIEKLQPAAVYTHHGGDLNIDHQIVHRAVLTATRPAKDCTVRDIYAFEVPSSTEWAFQQLEPVFRADVFVDIAETLDIKVNAMQLYESEARAYPHPRSPEALRAITRRWGSVCGLEAAEAFQLVRSIRPRGNQ